jgi:hypothetical protein
MGVGSEPGMQHHDVAHPLQSPRTDSSCAASSPWRTLPLLQFTRPSEYCRGGGIAAWVDDPSLAFTPLGVGIRGLPNRPGLAETDKFTPDPLVDFALLQSMTRAGPPASRVTEATRHRRLTLLGFRAPTAHEVAGSDVRRACLTRLRCVFRLPRPLDAFFPPSPCRSCFVPAALVGFALQRVSLPIAGASLDVPCPSWRLLSTIARPVMSPEHRFALRGPELAPFSASPRAFEFHPPEREQ